MAQLRVVIRSSRRSVAMSLMLFAATGAAVGAGSNVTVNAGAYGVEFNAPGGLENPQDSHDQTVTTGPALLSPTNTSAAITLSTGGNANCYATASIGNVAAYAYGYETYQYDNEGHEVANGRVAASASADTTETVQVTHPTLPAGTPVTYTATFTVHGSHSVPDQNPNFNDGFGVLVYAQLTMSDNVNSVSPPVWVSQDHSSPNAVITQSFDTAVGRVLTVRIMLQASAGDSSASLTARSGFADYSSGSKVTLAASVPGVNLVGDSGYNFAAPPPCPEDINGDGVVNTLDLGTLLSHFGQNAPAGTAGDVNGDGVVNTLDLGKLLSKFGTVCP